VIGPRQTAVIELNVSDDDRIAGIWARVSNAPVRACELVDSTEAPIGRPDRPRGRGRTVRPAQRCRPQGAEGDRLGEGFVAGVVEVDAVTRVVLGAQRVRTGGLPDSGLDVGDLVVGAAGADPLVDLIAYGLRAEAPDIQTLRMKHRV
jgi:hypothetical protein